jgi:hypothetical protein
VEGTRAARGQSVEVMIGGGKRKKGWIGREGDREVESRFLERNLAGY